MNFSHISISGYRGFEVEEEIQLAIPNGSFGSGLTVLVGPNNSGKSTIVESFRAMSQRNTPSFTEGKRNKNSGEVVSIKLKDEDNNEIELKTVEGGGSETIHHENGISADEIRIFTLPSRRSFNPYFSKGAQTREVYIVNSTLPAIRGQEMPNFYTRLFNIQENPEKFNEVLSKIISPLPSWYIEQNDSGKYYLKFNYQGHTHNSDGLGEGIISIFSLVDALYDSEPGDTLVIDEPELSLHPSLQKKLLNVLCEFSSNRQIIISTHSPFLIDWLPILNGGEICRTVKRNGRINTYRLSDKSKDNLKGLLNNLNNPHILGLDAKEVFFLDDNLIVVEGQEDVIFYRKIIEILGLKIQGNFYGWGIGGAGNLNKILSLLNDLGFEKVSVILDQNMSHMIPEFERDFNSYRFLAIPTDDVRDKDALTAKPAIEGLIDRGGRNLKEEFKEDLEGLFNTVNNYFENEN